MTSPEDVSIGDLNTKLWVNSDLLIRVLALGCHLVVIVKFVRLNDPKSSTGWYFILWIGLTIPDKEQTLSSKPRS